MWPVSSFSLHSFGSASMVVRLCFSAPLIPLPLEVWLSLFIPSGEERKFSGEMKGTSVSQNL